MMMILAIFAMPDIGKSQISSFPWTEGFENSGAIPTGWLNDTTDAGGDWLFVTTNSHCTTSDHTSGTGYYALLDDYNVGTSNSPFYLLTPTFDLSAVGKTYQLKYWAWIGADASTNPISIEASSDGGSTWASIFTHDLTVTGNWFQNTIILTAYNTNNVVIRVKGVSDYGYGTDNSGIDDFTIEEAPSCLPATNPIISNLSATSAQLNWTSGGASLFNIEYGPANFTPGTGIMLSVTSDTFKVISGLTANTSYDWYVQDSCGATDVSTWTAVNSFTTTCNTMSVFPWTESFESGFNFTCWNNTGTSSYIWETNNGSTHGPGNVTDGSMAAMFNVYNASRGNTATLNTPTFNMSAMSAPIITFDYWMNGSSDVDLWIKVEQSIDGTNWTTIFTKVQDGTINSWTSEMIQLSGFNATTQLRFVASSDYGSYNTYIDNIKIFETPSNELEVSTVLGSFGAYGADNYTVKAIIKNNGAIAQTNFSVNYSLDNGTPITETMASLPAFSTDTFTFTTAVNSGAVGTHSLAVYTSFANDENLSNDTAYATVINLALPYNDDFESYSSSAIPTYWNIVNTTGSSSPYAKAYSSSTGSNSGSMHFRMYNSSLLTGELIAALPKIGTGISNLKMDFWLKGGGSDLIIGAMTDPTDESTFVVIDTIFTPSTTMAEYSIIFNTYTGSGKYIAFKHGMNTTYDYIYIDDIQLFIPPTNEVEVAQIIGAYGGFSATTSDVIKVLVKNNGTAVQTAIPMKYSLDNGTIVVDSMNSLAAFSTDTFTFATTFDATVVGNHILKIYSDLANDENRANDTLLNSFLTYGAHTVPFTEDFEAGFTYFENSNSNNVDYTSDTVLFHSGSNSINNIYSVNNTNVLHEAGAIDLTSSSNPILDFWHIAKTEGGYDKCYIEISTNNGQTYTAIADSLYLGQTSNYAVKGYFHEDSYTEWGTSTQTPDNTWWKMERFNLEPFKADSVRIRFRLQTDGSANRAGWSIDDITVQEEPAATASLGNDTTICANETVSFEAGAPTVAGYSYLWTVNGDTISNTTNMLTSSVAGIYTVEVIGLGNTAYDTVVVYTNAVPTVTFTGSTDICNTQSTQLSVSFTGATPWNFTYVNMGVDTTNIIGEVTPWNTIISPIDTANYVIISVTDSNGCVSMLHSDTVTINVNPLPVVSFSALNDICENESSFALVGGTPALGIYSGVGVSAGNFSPTTSGVGNHTITYTFTDANGCSDSVQQIQVVNPIPSITIIAGLNPGAFGYTTTLNAQVSNFAGTLEYLWSPSNFVNGDSSLQIINTESIVNKTTYTVLVIDSLANTACSNQDTIIVTYTGGPVSVAPTASVNAICINNPILLTANSAGGSSNLSYVWTSNPAGFNSTDENPVATVTQSTWFIIEASDGITSDKDSVFVTGFALPTVAFSASDTICYGDSLLVTASFTGAMPFSYTYNGMTVNNVNAASDAMYLSPSVSTEYFITQVSDNNGCSASGNLDSITIGINALPTVSYIGSDTICYGDSSMATATFTGATPFSYTYDGNLITGVNAMSDAIYLAPNSSKTYVLTQVTDGNGCNSTGLLDSISIMVNALPTISGSDNDSICYGDSSLVELNFTGASPWNFTVNAGGTSFNDASSTSLYQIYVQPAFTTNYVLTSLTDGNGCTVSANIDSVEIFVNSLPAQPTYSGLSATYCADATDVTLSPTPAGGSFIGTGINGSIFSPSTAGSGVYDIIYEYTDSNGCSNSDTNSTVVNDLPVISISGLASDYCFDAASVTITALPTGGNLSGAGVTGSIFTPSVATAGNHTIYYSYTDANICTSIDSVSTLVNALPVVSLPTLSDICIDAPDFALTGATPAGGNWSGDGAYSNSFSTDSAGVGTFMLTYSFTDVNGCTNLDSTTQIVNGLPVLSFSGLQTGYCLNDIADTLIPTPIGGSFLGQGMSGNVFDPTVAGVGTYSLMYSYTDANGCSDSTSLPTIVYGLPSVALGADTTICAVNNIIINAGNFDTYLWNTGAFTSSITADSVGNGIGTFNYSVIVSDTNNCIATDSVNITFEATPTSLLTDSASICGEGANLNLDAGSNPLYTYLWNDASTSSNITVDSTNLGGFMNYMYVTITSPAGCTQVDSTHVYLRAIPMPFIGNDTTICWTQKIVFDAGAGFSSYLWSNGATSQTISLDSLTFALGANDYSVEVYNNVNCSNSDSITLVIDPCTGILTPEISGANILIYPNPSKGQFKIEISGLDQQDYNLGVFNSLGSQVFAEQIQPSGQSTQSWNIDLSAFAKGIYFVRLQSNNQIKVQRVIIQ